jgi:CBS domain containing-hemolysin-like protein
MLPLSLEIVLVCIAIVFYAFFSLVETSILTVRKSRLRELVEDEKEPERTKRKAQAVLSLKSQPEEFLATVQSGAVLSAILAATFASFIALEELKWGFFTNLGWTNGASITISIIITSLILLALLLTFGGLIPKSVALHQNLRFSLFFGEFFLAFIKVVKPLIHFPVVLANIVLKPFKDKASFTESRISEEEFRVMLEEGARTGVLDKTENELIENILDFRETTVREVMVPRTKVVGIDVETSREKVIEQLVAEGYTRLPVYRDTLDDVLGVVYSKDVLALIEHPSLIILEDIIRPATFVPETKLISELLRELQHKKFHMAIVVDEFGGTAGIVTLEDIIEEIVGEIQDEYDDEVPPPQYDTVSRTLLLPGNMSTVDANEYFEAHFGDFSLPEVDEYDSVGGYVTKLFGHIPETNERMETGGVEVVVLKRTPKEVLQVSFRNIQPIPAVEEETNNT